MNMQRPGTLPADRPAGRPIHFVTGASGNVGRHLVPELLWNGHHVRALTRRPVRAGLSPRAEPVQGDLTDVSSFERALQGVTGLHLITIGGDDYEPLGNGGAILDAAVAAGVRRVTVLSDGREGSIERAVRASGLEWTILRPVELMSNMLGWAHSIRTENIVRGPAGDMAKTMIHEGDVASAAAQILMHGGHREEVCRLSGPEALTMRQKVRQLNRVLGRKIRYAEVSEQHTRETMRRVGMREDVIDYVIGWDINPPAEARLPNHVFENIVRRSPSTLMDWLGENSHAFQAADITPEDVRLAASA